MRGRLILTGALGAFVACGGATAPAPAVSGTWTLVTVNGRALPFGDAGVGTDSTWLLDATLTVPAPGVVTTLAYHDSSGLSGRWARSQGVMVVTNPPELYWTDSHEAPEPLTLHGDTLSFPSTFWTATPVTYRFVRQP